MKNYKTPPEIRLEEHFESVIKSVLRPMQHQVQKSLETILEVAQRRCEGRMPLIRSEAISEYVLRWGVEMKLFTPADEVCAKELIEEIQKTY